MNPKRTIILYHQYCSDGWCALAIADLFYAQQKGTKTLYVGVIAGKTNAAVNKLIAEEDPDSIVYAFDLTFEYYPAKKLLSHFQGIIYDHHLSTESCYRKPDDESDEEFANTQELFKHCLIYDKSISGATLAWNAYFPTKPIPLLVQYVQDRDLWSWTLPDAKEVCAGLSEVLVTNVVGENLSQYEYNALKVREWSKYLLTEDWLEEAKLKGTIILSIINRSIKSSYKDGGDHIINNQLVRVCNTNMYISDLGNYICQTYDDSSDKKYKYDYAVLWRYDHNRDIVYVSMRSRKGGVDISKIAEQFKYIDKNGEKSRGGGHQAAAGFEITLEKFFEWIR